MNEMKIYIYCIKNFPAKPYVVCYWMFYHVSKCIRCVNLMSDISNNGLLSSVECYWSPKGMLGMSDATLPSGISGLSFDSPFLSPLLFFCLFLLLFLSCHFSANGPFS